MGAGEDGVEFGRLHFEDGGGVGQVVEGGGGEAHGEDADAVALAEGGEGIGEGASSMGVAMKSSQAWVHSLWARHWKNSSRKESWVMLRRILSAVRRVKRGDQRVRAAQLERVEAVAVLGGLAARPVHDGGVGIAPDVFRRAAGAKAWSKKKGKRWLLSWKRWTMARNFSAWSRSRLISDGDFRKCSPRVGWRKATRWREPPSIRGSLGGGEPCPWATLAMGALGSQA